MSQWNTFSLSGLFPLNLWLFNDTFSTV